MNDTAVKETLEPPVQVRQYVPYMMKTEPAGTSMISAQKRPGSGSALSRE